MPWFLYIVKCADNSLYTGVTNDTQRRINEHNTSDLRGSKYIRGKRPVQLIYSEEFVRKTDALKREAAIKNWNKANKIKLIKKKHPGFTL